MAHGIPEGAGDMSKYICRYCGEEKDWSNRNHDVGLELAKMDCFDALGHTEGAVAYLVCNECVEQIFGSKKQSTK